MHIHRCSRSPVASDFFCTHFNIWAATLVCFLICINGRKHEWKFLTCAGLKNKIANKTSTQLKLWQVQIHNDFLTLLCHYCAAKHKQEQYRNFAGCSTLFAGQPKRKRVSIGDKEKQFVLDCYNCCNNKNWSEVVIPQSRGFLTHRNYQSTWSTFLYQIL